MKQAIDKQKNDVLEKVMVDHLLENAKSAIFGAIELHNKPIFPSRYEVTVVLTINAWELLMKAYILKFLPDHKIFEADGTTKPFDKCLHAIQNHIGKDFLQIQESLGVLYKYRCDIIHFYGTSIESILYSLLRPNIIMFSDFIDKYFQVDLAAESNLIILPIGFKRTISPVDFLSKRTVEKNQAVDLLIESIKTSAQNLSDNGFEDGIMCNYNMHIEKENRLKNADILVGVTNDPQKMEYKIGFAKNFRISSDQDAPALRLDEESVFRDHYFLTYDALKAKAKAEIKDFKEGKKFLKILNEIKQDANLFKKRYLDINPTPKSSGKPYYSEAAFERLKNQYEAIT